MANQTEIRRSNAKASLLELIAQVRRDEMAGKYGKPGKQANAANIAALEQSASALRAKSA